MSNARSVDEADIVVISMLPGVEFNAVVQEFKGRWPGIKRVIRPGETSLFSLTTRRGWALQVAARAIVDSGNVASAIETTNMLARFNPRFAFLCGIAGNMNHDKRQLGDVIVSDAYSFKSFTRMSSGGKLESSMPQGPSISRSMRTRAQGFFGKTLIDFSGPDLPQFFPPSRPIPTPTVELGKIFCWDLVLDCDEARLELIQQDREYRAVEMEIYGFLRAIEAFSNLWATPVDGLAFRGLSDPASGKAMSDAGGVGWRGFAARNAARALVNFIDDLKEDDCESQRF